MRTNPTDTIHRVIERLHEETIKAVAMPPRDTREPGRRRKQLAEARLKAIIDRMFSTQSARIMAWLRLQRAFDAGAKLPPGWNEIPDKVMNDLVINLIESRQDGIRLFDEQVQTGIDYTATNARAARRAREYAGTLIKELDKTTETAVRNIIAAFAETPGMTMGDIIAQLPFDEQRARMIAVTEVTRAYADGELEAGIELQKKYPDVAVVKTWFTNNDEKVCPICEPLDGKEIDFEDGWSTGGEGDPEGLQGPPAHPNCRCWMQTRTKITKSIKKEFTSDEERRAAFAAMAEDEKEGNNMPKITSNRGIEKDLWKKATENIPNEILRQANIREFRIGYIPGEGGASGYENGKIILDGSDSRTLTHEIAHAIELSNFGDTPIIREARITLRDADLPTGARDRVVNLLTGIWTNRNSNESIWLSNNKPELLKQVVKKVKK